MSRPRPGRLCLDLGHKAVAADPAGDRLVLPGLPDATLGGQSEEHLVVETPDAENYPPGTPFLAIPTHICPTVALHQRAYVVRGRRGRRRVGGHGEESGRGDLTRDHPGLIARSIDAASSSGVWLPMSRREPSIRCRRTPRSPRALSTRSPSRPVRMPQPP